MMPNGQPGIQTGQTDGAGDVDEAGNFDGVLVQRDAAGNLKEMGRVEIDRMLHEQIAARAKAMEGGGLMLPLKEATRHRTATSSRQAAGASASGFDGGLDEDEDEDAINSDLDDPDDREEEEDGDDDQLQHVMLCMYDKVQRVKNKW
jgi:transcription initiation factor TFIIA large subunit